MGVAQWLELMTADEEAAGSTPPMNNALDKCLPIEDIVSIIIIWDTLKRRSCRLSTYCLLLFCQKRVSEHSCCCCQCVGAFPAELWRSDGDKMT